MHQFYKVDDGSFHIAGFEGTRAADHVRQLHAMGETAYPYLKARWDKQDAEERTSVDGQGLGSMRRGEQSSARSRSASNPLLQGMRASPSVVSRAFSTTLADLIGSHPSNEIVLDDPMVSRFHCRIAREGGAWRIVDLSSKNGTRVDGVKVLAADIERSATIAIGDVRFACRARGVARRRWRSPRASVRCASSGKARRCSGSSRSSSASRRARSTC